MDSFSQQFAKLDDEPPAPRVQQRGPDRSFIKGHGDWVCAGWYARAE